MGNELSDKDLPGYAYHHCRTERALFHAAHLRRLLEMAGMPVPADLKNSNGFFSVHEDQMDPILEAIAAREKRSKFTVIVGGKS